MIRGSPAGRSEKVRILTLPWRFGGGRRQFSDSGLLLHNILGPLSKTGSDLSTPQADRYLPSGAGLSTTKAPDAQGRGEGMAGPPRKGAAIDGNRHLSCRPLNRRVNRLARVPQAQGPSREDRPAILSLNGLECLGPRGVAWVNRAPGTGVPLPPRCRAW